MPITKTGQWTAARAALIGANRKIRPAIQKAVLKEAHFFRKKIVQGIREQAPAGKRFKPLSKNTIRVRKAMGFRGRKALIRTGDLRNSINVKKVGNGAFVGILRTARSKTGGSLANIGAIHEFGKGPFIVPITRRSKGFLARAKVSPLPGRVAIMTIPARPFIRPVFDKFGKPAVAKRRMMRRLAIELGKRFGRF